MLLSMNWLREFIPYTDSGEKLGEQLTMAGLETEGIVKPYEALRPIVTGLVAECSRHPGADKLSVCRVDVGDEVLDIVCGAPNVAAGQKVAVVRVGVTLPTGLTVSKAKLRGAPSNGMICSEFELGLSDEHSGIMVLDPAVPVGKSLLDALELDDEILDISVTPNRGDCLSVLGLAVETAALTGLPLTMPDYERLSGGTDASPELALEVEDGGLCPLYHGLIIEGTKTAPSPGKLRYRLNAAGVRPLSNLVDATNYVLMELGQPLHAFDLDRIRGGRVSVRAADAGERFVTLDGKERTLTAGDITIRDAEGVICLGGVMGGLNSEISDGTRRVFLESAVFNPGAIRRTARRLGLHSEASFRFERGVDRTGATPALERAAHMMAALSGGYVRPGLIKKAADEAPRRPIRFHREYAEKLLGVQLTSPFCEKTLRSLGCAVRDASGGLRAGEENSAMEWDVTPPARRHDLTREVDLAEEIVRIYGMDRVPARMPGVTRDLARAGLPESKSAFLNRVGHWGRQAGLNEIIAYSFVGGKELDLFGLPEDGRVPVLNPLNEDMDVLRPALVPGLLNALCNNMAQGALSVRLFETAAVFTADPASESSVREEVRLGILLHGARSARAWPPSPGDLDYLDIKGLIEYFLLEFSLPAADFVLSGADAPNLFSPCVDIILEGASAGRAGRVKPEAADRCHAKKDVWYAELDLDYLYGLYVKAVTLFRPLPVFPPVRRDITFVVPRGTRAGDIAAIAERMKSRIDTDVRLIDCYEPDGADARNLTFRLTFRRPDRTLKDAEADRQRALFAESVCKTLNVAVQRPDE
ncbi:MAG: phenylalanine--tRNA ligase subunit beta [Desulfovibrio sp.]|jgi:phenylalanyl-tRNA synthetase beta chain|nr:phenylalanine--tRNA ligase subunit beta [Desulfovibrio sp.]